MKLPKTWILGGFQFLIGKVKTALCIFFRGCVFPFQFLIGKVKTLYKGIKQRDHAGFNSS